MAAASIAEAREAADIEACRALFTEYQRELGVSLCFQGFDRELATLPGDYAPPRGRLWLARVAGAPAACVAMRPLQPGIAEMKRMYVRPAHRGTGLGRRLAQLAIGTARELGYQRLVLDTLPQLRTALALYAGLGFVQAPKYNDNPIENVRFLSMDLSPEPRAQNSELSCAPRFPEL